MPGVDRLGIVSIPNSLRFALKWYRSHSGLCTDSSPPSPYPTKPFQTSGLLFLMTQTPSHASGVVKAPPLALHGDAEANAFQQNDQESRSTHEGFSPGEKKIAERVAEEIEELIKQRLTRDDFLNNFLPEDLTSNSGVATSRLPTEARQNDTLDASGSKRIELRASSEFADMLNGLCRETGLSKADVIRRGVSLYARALLEKTHGRVLGIAALEDSQIKVKEIIQV